MVHRHSIGLLASAIALAPLPIKAQDGSAEDLVDVMSIGFKVVVKPTLGFQASLQGDGTPKQRTAFDISMPWSTLSSVTEMATAASTPMSRVGSPLSSASASAG